MVSLNSIYDSIAATEHTNVRSARNSYSEALEEQPVYYKTPFKFVAGDKPNSTNRLMLNVPVYRHKNNFKL